MVPCTRMTCLLVFLGCILKCQLKKADYRITVEGSRFVKESVEVNLKCIESNRASWAKSPLKWFQSTYHLIIIRDVEKAFRYSIRRCSNSTHRCITMIINNVAWYDNSTFFLCCAGSNKRCDRAGSMHYKGRRWARLQIIVDYKLKHQEKRKVYYGTNVTLRCPINIKHRDDIKFNWTKIIHGYRLKNYYNGTAYTFKHEDNLTVSYTCEANDEVQSSVLVRITNRVKHTFHIETLYTSGLYLTMQNLTTVTKDFVPRATLMCEMHHAKNFRLINTVKWYKDGRPVPGKHWTKWGSWFEFDPYKVYKNDISGRYRCEVTEGKITAHVSAEVRVVGKLNVTLIGPNILEEGKKYTMTCQTSGYPKPTAFIWHKGGNRLYRDYKHSVHVIKEATREDAGEYSCTATNSYGNVTNKKTVHVHYRPRVKVANVTAADKGRAEIKCTIESNTARKTIVWKHNDKPIVGNQEILKIQDVEFKDKGKYKCIVTNELGEGHGTGWLTVVDSTFITFPSDKQVNENATVTLPCATKDLKTMGGKRNWYKDEKVITKKDQVLTESSTYNVTYDVKESTYYYTLVITNIKFRHRGRYTCEMGIKKVSAFVTVQVPPKQPIISAFPSFKDNQTVNMTCSSKIQNVYPEPILSWYQDGQRLKNQSQKTSQLEEKMRRVSISRTIVTTTKTVISVLTIFLRAEDHKSTITCTVENPAGSKKRSATLNVTYAPIIQPLGADRIISAGETIQLTCSYKANPKATFLGWFKTPTSNKIHDSPTLTIKNATKTDSGTYSCKVGNGPGDTFASIRIDVMGSSRNILPPSTEGSSLGVIIGGIIAALVVLSVIPIVFFCRKKSPKRREVLVNYNRDSSRYSRMDYRDTALPEQDQPYQMNDQDLDMGDVPKWQGSKTSITISTGKKKKKKKKNQTSISNSSTESDGKKKRKKKKHKKKKGSNTSLGSKGSGDNTASGDASVSGEKGKKKKKKKKNQKGGSRTSLRSKKNKDKSKKRKPKKKAD